jgi:hypothetical protein
MQHCKNTHKTLGLHAALQEHTQNIRPTCSTARTHTQNIRPTCSTARTHTQNIRPTCSTHTHSLPPSAEVKNAWSYAFTPPDALKVQKGKVFPFQAMKAYMGSMGIALLVLELGQEQLYVVCNTFIHSFCSLSYDRHVASSKASSPQGAI